MLCGTASATCSRKMPALALSRIIMRRRPATAKAADSLQKIPVGTSPPEMVEATARLVRTTLAKAASPQTLPPLRILGWVYL